MKKKRLISIPLGLFFIGFSLVWIGAVFQNDSLVWSGGVLCALTPITIFAVVLISRIIQRRADKTLQQQQQQPYIGDITGDAASVESSTKNKSYTVKNKDMAKSKKDEKQKAYDAVLYRDWDFTDWLQDNGKDELYDEYTDKSFDLWDEYTGEEGDDTLARITALLDEYEGRTDYVRPEHSIYADDDDEDDEEDHSLDAYAPTTPTKRTTKIRGCVFPAIFVAIFIMTIVFFTNGITMGGVACFVSLFAIVIIFISSAFIKERIAFSTKINPDKYYFANGVVRYCYCTGTTTVNGVHTYKTFELTLDVDGKEVVAYARQRHEVGETVHLAIRKDKPRAKLVDADGKAVYCYKYDFYHPPASARSATVAPAQKQNADAPASTAPSVKATDEKSAVRAAKSPFDKDFGPDSHNIEVIVPTPAVEDLCAREEQFIDALEDRGLFAASEEYRRRAETFWSAYRGGASSDDDAMLKNISDLIELYTAMYLGDNKKSSQRAVRQSSQSSQNSKKSSSVPETSVAEKSTVEDKHEKLEKVEKLEKPEQHEKIGKADKPNRSYKKAAASVKAEEQPTAEDEQAKAATQEDAHTNGAETAEANIAMESTTAEESFTAAEENAAKDTDVPTEEEPTLEYQPPIVGEHEEHAFEHTTAPRFEHTAQRPTREGAASKRLGYKPSKKK